MSSSSQSVLDRIKQCESLPTLPAAALHVLQLTANDEAEVNELAETIRNDPALSVKLLRAVNSSFYGLSQKVSNVQQAVALLGLRAVKTLVLGFSLISNLRNRNKTGFNHLHYWRRSMYSATAARIIGQKVFAGREEDCFVAALLMDIGTLVLDQVLGDEYGELYERIESHSDLPIAETHHLGIAHPEVSGHMAQGWKLPEILAVPMANHHAPRAVEDPVLRRVTEVIWLAGRCGDVFSAVKSHADSIASVRASCRQLYSMGELESDALLTKIGQKTRELAELFDVRLQAAVNYEQILAQASERLLELSIGQNPEEGREKRRANRMRRDGKMKLTPCNKGVLGQAVEVRLKDISTTGIGLIHSERLEVGSQFIIHLPDRNGPRTLLYTVVRCETYGGLSSIGAQLTSVLRPETANASGAA
jgi:HD-like signal output (HDOD) protein